MLNKLFSKKNDVERIASVSRPRSPIGLMMMQEAGFAATAY